MIRTYSVVMTDRATKNLRAIAAFIGATSPHAASSLISDVMSAIRTLDATPYRYAPPRGRKFRNPNIRSMPVPPYLVRYRIDERLRTVFVTRVCHGARRSPW